MNTFPQAQILSDADATRAAGRVLAGHLRGGMVIALCGDLGAGKTTLTQGILEALRVEPPYPSPTFILMHQYDVAGHEDQHIKRVYHIDAYRVDAKDLQVVGWEEWCADAEGVMIVEWPERVADILPSDVVWIDLSVIPDGGRQMIIRTGFSEKE
ncbi:MAG: tRNA (adenosine(37)-N6)-threonylcarbamoyltransferase complex ATPase subunit type 1 TsaE [Candidatus Moraniibacteriota bacterium]